MAKRTGPSNLSLKQLIIDLRKLSNKENVKIWKRISQELLKPSRQRRYVNLYSFKYLKQDETAIVPGKVLSEGEFKMKNTVSAFRFSEKAKEKISKSGKAISIRKLMEENPKGKKVRIIC